MVNNNVYIYTAIVNHITDCGAPDHTTGTTVVAPTTTYGSEASYSCATGYENLLGTTTRTCESDGSWSGAAPDCIRKGKICLT